MFTRSSRVGNDYMTSTVSQRIGEYVRELTARHLASPSDFRVLPQVIDIWRLCVGDSLAGHVRPVFYRQGRLVLHAASSVWASRIQQQRATIATHLRSHPPLAGLRELQVRVIPEQTAVRPAPPAPAIMHAAGTRCLTDLASHVDDGDLREALRRLAGRGQRS